MAVGELNDELFADTVGPGKGVLIPYRWVRAVGDIVLVNSTIERLQETDDTDEAAA